MLHAARTDRDQRQCGPAVGAARRPAAHRCAAAALLAMQFAVHATGQTIEPVELTDDFLNQADVRALIDTSISGEAIALVALLDDQSFAERERAMARLTGLLTRQECELLLRTDALSLEQRYRLLEVLRTTVINRPRGAIGIQMDAGAVIRRGIGPTEVVVSMVVEDMPAAGKLQVQDRITHIDGQPVFSNDFIIDYVQLRQPGDRVTMSVKRPQRDAQGRIKYDEAHEVICDELDVEITLGNTDQLDNPSLSTAVDQQIREVNSASTRYMPRPTVLRFADGVGPGWDAPNVDDHPSLQALISLQRPELAGRLTMSEQLETVLALQREQIERAIEESPIGSDDRTYLRSVLQRFDELMKSLFDNR